MKTVKPVGLLMLGILAFFLAGCFNPVGVVPSNTEAASVVEPFSVDVFIGPDDGTRSVAGPDAARIKGDIRNIVQLIVMDDSGNIAAFDEVRREKDADGEAKLRIDSVPFGRTYHFLLLMGHWERTYQENTGADYIYTANPPTLLAAGLKTQEVTGSGKITITMWPVVVDTTFVSPTAGSVGPVVNTGKPEEVSLLPVDWNVRWTLQQGLGGNGLSDLVNAQKIPAPLAGDALLLKSDPPQTLVRKGAEAGTWSGASLIGNEITQGIGTYTAGFGQIGTNGSVNFKMEYVPFHLIAGGTNPWAVFNDESVFNLSGNGEPVWIIRNGVNDLAQNGNTDFTNFHNIGNSGMGAANGNGAVRFVVVPKTPGGQGGSTLVVKDGVFLGPAGSTTPDIRFTTDGYAETAEGYYAVVVKDAGPPEYSAYTESLDSLAVDTHTKQITLPDTADYDVYVIIFKDGAVSAPLKINTGSGGTGVDWIWGDEPYLGVYVASNGNDDNPGTRASPVATVQRALVRLGAAYDGDPGWPGRETEEVIPGGIIIMDKVNVAEQIDISNFHLPVILRDDPEMSGGTLQATSAIGSGKSVLKLSYNTKMVILSGGLTLKGTGKDSGDNIIGVNVDGYGSTFIMTGGAITDFCAEDTYGYGSGVKVSGINCTFIMTGGVISNNFAAAAGGGVYGSGEFIMTGGIISYNSSRTYSGGGVRMSGNFTMNGGEISHNTALSIYGGGGVVVTGSFTMNGGEISYNSARNGGGLWMQGVGFTMNGGKISHNTALTSTGGGIEMQGGTFTMKGGEISYNSAPSSYAGGIYMLGTKFTMDNGEISYNSASTEGGGIWMQSDSFTMNGGIISNNSAGCGGGLHLFGGSFTMTNGIISGNTASSEGGGIWMNVFSFVKTGGTIYGYAPGDTNSNVVKNASNILANKGHAVYVNDTYHKETTMGPELNLFFNYPEMGDHFGW